MGDGEGFINFMGDEKDALTVVAPNFQQHFHHVVAEAVVQRLKGLIHEEELALRVEGAGDTASFEHATGELLRIIVFKAFEANLFDKGQDMVSLLFFLDQLNIFVDGPPREDSVVLEDEADVGDVRMNMAPILGTKARDDF